MKRFLFSPLLLIAAITVQAEDVTHTEKLSAIKEQIDSLQTWLKDARNQHDSLYQSIKASDKSIADLEKQTSVVSSEVKERESKLTKLNAEEAQLKKEITEKQASISKNIRSAYLIKKQEPLKLLLNAEDPTTLARLLTYYDYINEQHSDEINSFNEMINQLVTVQNTMTSEKTQLQSQATQLQQKQKALDKERDAHAKLMAELNSRINSTDAQLKKLMQDRAQLEKIIASVSQKTTAAYIPPSDTRPFASWKGKLPWPLAGKVLHRFGQARVQNKVSWEGITIAADEGTPVRAVYHGRVVFAESLRGFGLLVIVDHGNNYMSLYAHNQKTLKSVGSNVKSGDNIALSGSSESPIPALYFEIRQSGKPQDPGTWLNKTP